MINRMRVRPKVPTYRRSATVVRRTVALAAAAVVLTSCGSWKGIANVAVPGGPGTGPDSMTVYVQMPDTLALNVNSRVRVADVFVGTVRGIGESLQQAHRAVEGDVSGVVAGLGIAFNSTLVALGLSILIMFLLHQIQLRQERAVLDTEEFLDAHVVRQMLVR